MRGDGFLYRRGQVYHASYNVRGRQVRRSLHTTDPDVARERLRELRAVANDTLGERPWLHAALDRLVAGELDGSQVVRLRGPIVYAWFRDDRALYVGKGEMGIARPLSQRHHRLLGILPTDKLRIWCCDSPQHAIRRELDLIQELKPSLNIKRRARP